MPVHRILQSLRTRVVEDAATWRFGCLGVWGGPDHHRGVEADEVIRTWRLRGSHIACPTVLHPGIRFSPS